jgi:hypothetical protein
MLFDQMLFVSHFFNPVGDLYQLTLTDCQLPDLYQKNGLIANGHEANLRDP